MENHDVRVEEVKAQLIARIEEIARRVHDMRSRIDVAAYVAEHPWPAVGVAFAAGALLALRGRRRSEPVLERGTGGMITAMLGALAMRIVKDVALGQASDVLRSWWLASDSERDASFDPSVEVFVEH